MNHFSMPDSSVAIDRAIKRARLILKDAELDLLPFGKNPPDQKRSIQRIKDAIKELRSATSKKPIREKSHEC